MSVPGPLSRPEAEALLHHASELADAGEYDQAAAFYARLVGNADPEIHVVALLGLAEARYRLDNEPGALQAWITATQAPETSNTWRAWKALAAARVREGDLPGAIRCYREALRRAPADERAEISGRLGWLTKEQGSGRTAERYFSRARVGGLTPPYATYAILAVTIVIGVLSLTVRGQADFWYGLFELKKTGPDSVASGEWWRLVTVVLVHDDQSFLHLAFNMYALWIVGPIVEALYGWRRFIAFYVLTAAAGSAASYLFNTSDAVGASGAIFGLFGILFMADRVHKPALLQNARNLSTQIGILIVINLAIDVYIPGIDITAHIGGVLAGLWLGLLIAPRSLPAPGYRRPIAPGPMTGVVLPAQAPRAPTALAGGSAALLQLAGVLALVGVIAIFVGLGPAH